MVLPWELVPRYIRCLKNEFMIDLSIDIMSLKKHKKANCYNKVPAKEALVGLQLL